MNAIEVLEARAKTRAAGVTHYDGCWENGGINHAGCEEAQRQYPPYHSPEWWDMTWKKHEAWREGNYPAAAGTGWEVTPVSGVEVGS